MVNTNEISLKEKLFIFQVAQANVYAPATKPSYSPVISNPPIAKPNYAAPGVISNTPAPTFAAAPIQYKQQHQQQQRPASIHGFSNLQNPAPSKPLSPLPLLQTASPQMHSPVYGSPRGWSHVNPSHSPSANVYQQPNYNAAPVASPFELNNSTNSFGQPQVRSEFLTPERRKICSNIGQIARYNFTYFV